MDVATAQITGAQYILSVENAERTSRYFQDFLGFDSHDTPDDIGSGWRVVQRGEFRIWIGECTENFTPISHCQDHSLFAYVFTNDVDALYGELVDRGADIWHDIETKSWGMREFAVVTIDQHRIVFSQRVD